MVFKKHNQSHLIRIMRKVARELSLATTAYLAKKAMKDFTENNMVENAIGKSNAEKERKAKASEAWLAFHIELNAMDDAVRKAKLKYDILKTEFIAQIQDEKLDGEMIHKGEEDDEGDNLIS